MEAQDTIVAFVRADNTRVTAKVRQHYTNALCDILSSFAVHETSRVRPFNFKDC